MGVETSDQSVTQAELDTAKAYLVNLINLLNSNGPAKDVHTAMAYFSDVNNRKVRWHLHTQMDTAWMPNSINNHITLLPGRGEIHEFIKFATNNMFNWNGGRPGAEKVLIILHNGKSFVGDAGKWEARNEGNNARAAGWKVFTVAYGSNPHMFHINKVAGEPDEFSPNVFQVGGMVGVQALHDAALGDAAQITPPANCALKEWTWYNDGLYGLSKHVLKQADAKQCCENHFGHLVEISSAGEDNHIKSLNPWQVTIGLERQAGQTNWNWLQASCQLYPNVGSPCSYNGFNNNNLVVPNEKGCAIIDQNSNAWKDNDCDQTERFVCEK